MQTGMRTKQLQNWYLYVQVQYITIRIYRQKDYVYTRISRLQDGKTAPTKQMGTAAHADRNKNNRENGPE